MTAPVDGPLTEAEVMELLAIAHLAPLAVDYDDGAWTAAGCPSDQATRNARDRFARVAPRLARDLLGAHDELGRVAKACGDFFTGGELLSGEVLHGVEAMGRDRDGWQARAYRAEESAHIGWANLEAAKKELLGARERIAGLERDQQRARAKVAEALAARLQAERDFAFGSVDGYIQAAGMAGLGCAPGCSAKQCQDDEPAGHLPGCLCERLRAAVGT